MDVRALLESTLVGLGYEFVDLELTRSGGFRLFIDKPEGITVDDCVLVSNHLTRLFMVENIDYDRLEVSSPGLDRPLKKEQDFVRFTGQLAKVKTRMPLEGRKNFHGRLCGVGRKRPAPGSGRQTGKHSAGQHRQGTTRPRVLSQVECAARQAAAPRKTITQADGPRAIRRQGWRTHRRPMRRECLDESRDFAAGGCAGA